MTLSILAATPRLTRSQLKQVQMTKDHKVQPSTEAGRNNSLSLQQVLKQRNLTLDDNKLTSAAPSRLSSVQPGDKMASADVYDFDWDDNTATATVIDSTGAMIGKKCYIEQDPNSGDWNLSGLYGFYIIPINVNVFSSVVTIPAGVDLCSFSSLVIEGGTLAKVTWTLYAMPLSWLEGDNDYHDIQGVLHADGSIEFTDDFGFLVEKHYTLADRGIPPSTWGLSPIFKNLILYNPNAIHHFERSILGSTPGNGYVIVNHNNNQPMGSGGTVPKPIKPRPAIFSGAGSSKPVTPRDFTPSSGTKLANQENNDSQVLLHASNNAGATRNSTEPQDFRTPVYIYQLDDTTLMAYNLFGADYCWNYMNIYSDGSVFIPDQPMSINSSGDELYNCSGVYTNADTLSWGNVGTYSQNMITWGNTYLCSDKGNGGRYRIEQIIINNEIWLLGANGYSWEQLPAPENLTVTPSTTTAEVAWQDTLNTSWQLRYRPWTDTSANTLDCSLDANYYDILADLDQNWFILDEDGDGNTWTLDQDYDGYYCLSSYSWDVETEQGLYPDNWLISPLVELKGVLRFTVWGNDYFPDKLMPYVCIGEPDTLDDFIPLAMDDIVMTSEKTEYTFDLLAFTGQKGHIAFRHYDSYNQSFVCIDDIFVGENQPFKWTYFNDLSTTNCTIDGLTAETLYEVQVQALGDDAVSDWTQPVTFTTLANIQTGDVNGDGQVKINDVSALISYLLSDETTGINLSAADCNHDGEIKINDVSALISYLLSGSW